MREEYYEKAIRRIARLRIKLLCVPGEIVFIHCTRDEFDKPKSFRYNTLDRLGMWCSGESLIDLNALLWFPAQLCVTFMFPNKKCYIGTGLAEKSEV